MEVDGEKFVEELKELQDGIASLEEVVKQKEAAKSEEMVKYRYAKRQFYAIVEMWVCKNGLSVLKLTPYFFLRSVTETKNNFILKVTNAFDKVKQIILEIKQHKDKNIPLEMDKIKEANDKLMEKQKQIMADRDALTKRIDTLKDELAKQEVRG